MGEDWTINSIHRELRRTQAGFAAETIAATPHNALNAVSCCNVNLYQGEPNGLQMTEGKFTIGGGTNSVSHFNDNTVEFNDDFTMVRGKHQFVFGGEFVWNQLNISNAYESNGIFTFNGTFSGSGPNGGTKVGDQNLDFLWGTLSAFQQSKMQQNALRAPIPSLYFQDTTTPPSSSPSSPAFAGVPSGCPSTSSIAAPSSTTTPSSPTRSRLSIPTLPPERFFYGDKGVPRAFTEASPWQFSPNFGIAYDLNGRGTTVIRGGFELIYDQVNFFTGQRTQQNPPFATAISQSQTSTSGPMSFSSPWSVGQITTNPFPQPAVPTPLAGAILPAIAVHRSSHPVQTAVYRAVDRQRAAPVPARLADAAQLHRQPHPS